jgi:glycosyltransferase involved in cell wall biosynthesis
MKILILSFYFYPDLSAGSFRATALVKALIAKAPQTEIRVVTTLPNRYESFSVDAPEHENSQGVSITRIALPAHKSGMLDQSKAFLYFAWRVRELVKDEHYDLVFATSSRLMTAVLGAWIARRKACLLYLDIRDIFVDTIKDVLPSPVTRISAFFFSFLERWAVNSAINVNLVSGGFRRYFETRYPRQTFTYFTNGIDDEFLEAVPRVASSVKTKVPLVALYAGNLGEGQGLHSILPELARRCTGRVHFKVFGDGGRKAKLLEALAAVDARNVEICPPVPRARLIMEYERADVLFLHLNSYEAFAKVLPSKIFEYAALGKPVWAGVSGFSADFLRQEVDNAAVFEPCDAESAVRALDHLVIEDRPRAEFVEKYSREAICSKMATDILVRCNA